MSSTGRYPGTSTHQRFLAAVAGHYASDPRVRAVCVFGSLGRGTWDEYSDVDLDVVVADDAAVDPADEVRRLCLAAGEEPVVVDRDGPQAVDVVLPSLLELSVRFHPLADTSPNIVDSLVVIAGPLDDAAVRAAGLANRRPEARTAADHARSCLRQAVTLDGRLHRREFWLAYQMLYLMRLELLLAVARSRGATRPFHALSTDAGAELRERLAPTLPGEDLPSLQRAFVALLDLLEHHLPSLTAKQAGLDAPQLRLLRELRRRQESLDFANR
jgi:predicted nucleotidyltransferase